MYTVLTVAQLGMPALGAACATVIFAAFAGRAPGAVDTGESALDHLRRHGGDRCDSNDSGGTVERMLERASWVMIVLIFAFLL